MHFFSPLAMCATPPKLFLVFPLVYEKKDGGENAREEDQCTGAGFCSLGDVTSSLRRCCPRRRPSFISAFPPSSYLIFFHSTKANQCWNNGRRLRLTQPCCDFVSAVRNFPFPAPPVIFPPQPPAPPLKSTARKVQKAERAAEKCALAFPNESH